MHVEDLARCEYGGHVHARFWRVPLLAIGWLEDQHSYSRGAVPVEVRNRLQSVLSTTQVILRPMTFAGLHECSLCRAAGTLSSPLQNSAFNMFIPGKDCVYAVPGAIDHYLEAHDYRPPEVFCDAVLQCPLCDTPEYWQALQALNGGPVLLLRIYKLDGENYRVAWDGDRIYEGQELEDLKRLFAERERKAHDA